jgi:ATP-dependent DNA helicase RecG
MPVKSPANGHNGSKPGIEYLFSDIQYLKGVGPKKGEVLRQNGISTVFDLFYYVPRKYVDRSLIVPINALSEGMSATVLGKIAGSGIIYGRQRRFVAMLEDNTGYIELIWFKGYRYLDKVLHDGDIVCVSGTVRQYGNLNIPHPEFEVVASADDETIHTGRLIPIYPENASLREIGLTSRTLRRIIKPALDVLTERPCETIPDEWRRQYGLASLERAIQQVHFPDTSEMADAGRQRLAFEELFYLELIMAGRRNKRRQKANGIVLQPPKKNGRQLLDSLGFKLTKAQIRVLNQIYVDMSAPYQMNRLLQGDVGSGKTIVAVLAMLGAIESGYQAAIMAPTEILAEQHYYSMSELLRPLGISATLLTSSVKSTARREAMEKIASGDCPVVIGTHALIEKKVNFAKLGFVVIDEQHRFGVMQRALLQTKGKNPDILVMTATPIPRTLAMTVYGDLDVSIIDEMPPDRIPIITEFIPEDRRRWMYDFIRKKVGEGSSVYIIYPLIEETEKLDLKAATQGYEHLKKVFPNLRLGLMHGKLSSQEKLSVMTDFKERRIDILVATTIVEVGLDVKSANVMVIEHGERFGLSQLHQLRGRVGRSGVQSFCCILSGEHAGEDGKKRIEVIVSSTDGFKIAEADLELRGPGEVLGTRQHGLPELKVARLTDTRLVELARRLAFEMVEDDPTLIKPGNIEIKSILKKRLGSKLRFAKIG